MAKQRKRATALFEVMGTPQASIKPLSHSGPFFRPPKWWVNLSHRRSEPKPKAKAIEPPAVRIELKPQRLAPLPPAPAPVPVPHVAPAAPKMPVVPIVPVAVDVPAEPMRIGPKPSRGTGAKKLTIHLDWTNAVIAVSSTVIVLGLGYMVVQKLQHTPVPTLAAMTTTELRRQPTRPDVLELSRRPSLVPVPVGVGSPEILAATARPDRIATPAVVGKRVINMNYVVIQAYPDEKLANEGADLLNRNGVPCNVIKGLSRWSNPRWYSIVGTQGFGPRSSGTPEVSAYFKRVAEVSKAFAGKSKWKQFEPALYAWKADSEN